MQCPLKFDKPLLAPRHWLSWLGVGILWVISRLPLKTRHKIGKIIGNIAYKKNHKRRGIAQANLKYCFPEKTHDELKNIIRQNFRFAAIAFIEYGVLVFAGLKRLGKMIDYSEFLQICRQHPNKGMLFLTAHSVFIDFCGPGFFYCRPSCALYKKFRNPVVDYLISRARCRFAKFLVSRDDSIKQLLKHLKHGGCAVYLPDEDLGKEHSVFVSFFTATKATLTTSSRICRISGAMAVPLMTVWDKNIGKYRMTLGQPLENFPANELDDARQINRELEKLIRPFLPQYMWTLKLFQTRSAGENDIYD